MAEPGQHIDLSLELPGDLIEDNQPKRLLPNEDYEIDGIIDQYDEGKGKTKKTWYLVTWTGYPEPSWVLSQRVNAKAMVSEWKMKVKKMTKSERAMINVEPASRPGNYKRIALEVSDDDMDNIPDEVNEPLSDDHSDEDSNSDTNDGHKDTSNRKRGRSSK
jgi:hypothetical protein